MLAKGARDRAQAADVLHRAPPGIVASAIRVGDESGRHRAPRRRRDDHSASSRSASSANIHQRSPGDTCTAGAAGADGEPRSAYSDASGAASAFPAAAVIGAVARYAAAEITLDQ